MTFIPATIAHQLDLNEGELQILADTANFARVVYTMSRVLWFSVLLAMVPLMLLSYDFYPFGIPQLIMQGIGVSISLWVTVLFISVNVGMRQLTKLNTLSRNILSTKHSDTSRDVLFLMEQYSGNILRPLRQDMPQELNQVITYAKTQGN